MIDRTVLYLSEFIFGGKSIVYSVIGEMSLMPEVLMFLINKFKIFVRCVVCCEHWAFKEFYDIKLGVEI